MGEAARDLKTAINKHMYNGTAFCDGLCEDPRARHTAFHSSVYMLALGAVSDEHRQSTWEFIKSRIDPPFSSDDSQHNGRSNGRWPPPPPPGAKDGMPCGTYVSQFVQQALYAGSVKDHGDAALEVLVSDAKNSWVHMLKQGATTTMEMWTRDEKPNLTWSHVWSASPAFVIPWFLFGIPPLDPGWTKLEIKPAPGKLTHGAYTIPTVKGPVSASFKANRASGAFQLEVVLPLGTLATIYLPRRGPLAAAGASAVFSMDGRAVKQSAVQQHHFVAIGVAPGKHVLSVSMASA